MFIFPAIAIPVGMSSQDGARVALPVQDVLVALDSAEKHLDEGLRLTLGAGDVVKAREVAVSLTLVKIFQTSLGRLAEENGVYASSLLGECLASSPPSHTEEPPKIHPPHSP